MIKNAPIGDEQTICCLSIPDCDLDLGAVSFCDMIQNTFATLKSGWINSRIEYVAFIKGFM
jgi:hypothetical protein